MVTVLLGVEVASQIMNVPLMRSSRACVLCFIVSLNIMSLRPELTGTLRTLQTTANEADLSPVMLAS